MRDVIEEFLASRCEEKLEPIRKKLAKDSLDDGERCALLYEMDTIRGRFDREVWLADAAKRSEQIKLATHVVKMTHPEAKGSSLFVSPDASTREPLLDTACLARSRENDVVGNAAALDVYKFLCVRADGETLMSRVLRGDPELPSALSDDIDLATSWCAAFAALAQVDGAPVTHPLAKQLYWSHDDGSYTLIAPLASSSLASAVHAHVNEEIYSADAKAARDARKAGAWSERPVRYFADVVEQKMGGSKPQNISLLNSQRGGTNYLLPSLPPIWTSHNVRLPRHQRSVFARELNYHNQLGELCETLAKFLMGTGDYTNVRIRAKRRELIQAIVDRTLAYGYRMQSQQAGWSTEARLDIEESCWLDPGRATEDDDFAAIRRRDEWRDEVCRRFGNWVNAQCKRHGLYLDGDAQRHWSAEFSDELKIMTEAL